MSNGEPYWVCERSVEADVPVAFAWGYMTDVRNWNDPPAQFSLDGPFVAGARGTTIMPGDGPPYSWTIRDVARGRGYSIVSGSSMDRAVLVINWRFDPLPENRVRLTQRLELHGENAAAYIDQIRAGFEPTLEPGLRRIAGSMSRAATGLGPDPGRPGAGS